MESLETLYADLNPCLFRILRSNLIAPDGLLEDACQVAWSSLLARREEVLPGHELQWLSTTATRIALRQLRDGDNEILYPQPTRDCGRAPSPGTVVALAPSAHEVVELRERLAEIHQLPVRQAKMLWMRGLGYGYSEISELTGDSERTVERQLYKATQRLARAAAG